MIIKAADFYELAVKTSFPEFFDIVNNVVFWLEVFFQIRLKQI